MLFLSLEPPSAGSLEVLPKPAKLLILGPANLLLRFTAVSGTKRSGCDHGIITVKSFKLPNRMAGDTLQC